MRSRRSDERALVALDAGEPASRSWTLAITPLGRDVVAGRADWLAHHRLDRWLGGVHLIPPRLHWRWDGRARRLLPVLKGGGAESHANAPPRGILLRSPEKARRSPVAATRPGGKPGAPWDGGGVTPRG